MAVLINFKICDNDKACSGMAACPKGVFSWDDEKKTLLIDNSKCVSCGLCEKACMVHAIKVAKTEEDYKRIQKEFDDDPRSINDLLVERFGAKPIDDAMVGSEGEIATKLEAGTRPLIIELFNEDSIQCLLKSILVKKIADAFSHDTRYRKVEVVGDELCKAYGVSELPALLFFKKGKLLGKLEGYVDDDSEDELLEKVQEIAKR